MSQPEPMHTAMTNIHDGRFSRQIILPEIGPEGQKRIAAASVLIIGLGGLGCPVALYLTGAGVGHIGLADHDTVSESNLHRQLLYTFHDIGKPKVVAAHERLAPVAPSTVFDTYPDGITENNAAEIFSRYDLIVDCTDNHAARYLTDSVCTALGKTWIYGSVSGFTGLASVFTPGNTFSYADLFPDRDLLLSQKAAAEGVIGPTPGVLGCIEAAEALKILAGIPSALAGKLLSMNLLTMNFELMEF